MFGRGRAARLFEDSGGNGLQRSSAGRGRNTQKPAPESRRRSIPPTFCFLCGGAFVGRER